MLAPPVTDGHHATSLAAGHLSVGLDRDHQPAVPAPHIDHVHPLNVELGFPS
jgi:hypothetical protein